MANPRLAVYAGEGEILAQDDWGDLSDAVRTAEVAEAVGAFPLVAGSTDAAFVVTLAPGIYTVVGSSADPDGAGVLLVEIYEVP
jgi:hypothetical protein